MLPGKPGHIFLHKYEGEITGSIAKCFLKKWRTLYMIMRNCSMRSFLIAFWSAYLLFGFLRDTLKSRFHLCSHLLENSKFLSSSVTVFPSVSFRFKWALWVSLHWAWKSFRLTLPLKLDLISMNHWKIAKSTSGMKGFRPRSSAFLKLPFPDSTFDVSLSIWSTASLTISLAFLWDGS